MTAKPPSPRADRGVSDAAAPDAVEIWLIRHGQSEWNRDRRLQGWSDIPLDETGRRQAHEVGQWLREHDFDSIWASDLSRAVETARLALGEPTIDLRLRELGFGTLEGARWPELGPEIQAAMKGFSTFRAPGGESTDELLARTVAFYDHLPTGRHAVFAHGGVMRSLLAQVGEPRFVANGAVVAVEWRRRELLFVRELVEG